MNYKSPVYGVTPVHYTKLKANNYNPNTVPTMELKLLEKSIWEDGYTQPIVCFPLEESGNYEIIDGFHRYTIMKTSKRIRERENEMLPVVILEKDAVNRIASTIRHNRARGFHNVELMSNIVGELVDSGMSDNWIMKNIGMDANEILRLKQVSGLAHLFLDKDFSKVPD
ncbi:IbrB-like domain-containing protein [Listeria welshimeri]|uniref:Chromosome partitioning protein ParB n=1 Tax=Listeria welshimeri TaxID=1643 RepID=A0A7X0T672_LISWE|nr:ParB/RepB/Spo0J family partition protein [Listeria welshimeri]MBC1323358.1 ParB-like nuclease domain-containing protein [Listeria welshimeri]MBC1394962.1 ParB-like nuclease domain-containing protein [Listeria welshimeri]MBC1517540.1 ParB-like nuclease domain-containing protein [Listeria welshimeri]MBC1642749.1 ParB-like nuclease domain-containing protein [Listeria welshimeri]MBC1676473.1 ParB-like nuclease domain-containing protein [Listeria welshimeri]